jgi:hypothetical protein
MKRLTGLVLGIISLIAMGGVAQAADLPTKQEARVWYDQNLTLAFTPNWSFTVMPGARFELARTREQMTGVHFLEFFIGPNYTYKSGNLTIKGSLWYYYMGYPLRGRWAEDTANPGPGNTVCTPYTDDCRKPSYNFSHNLEIIPSVEYRWGRWSFYDRVIFHNTFYADTYNSDQTKAFGVDVQTQRYGWGTVLRQLMQVRYALTDRLTALLADEPFFGILEDSDTKKLRKLDANGNPTNVQSGYKPTGYWKNGFRLNRVYLGIDYKVTPALSVTPMYMLETSMNPTDSSDMTDIAHNAFIIVTYVAKLFDDKK